MSDPYAQRDIARRLEQTQVIERPGASGQSTFYASGTWTPTFAGLTGAGSYTYVAQNGFYTRVGNICHIYGRIGISAITVAPTGGMVILTLPFVSSSVVGSRGAVSWGYVSNLNLSAGAWGVTGNIDPGESGIRLNENFDNLPSAAFPAAQFSNANVDITFFGSYPV